MIQFTVACILLLVAYRNRRSFVQWISALHKNVQKIKPAMPSLLKLPGSSRGDDSTASGNDGPQGLQPETSSSSSHQIQQQQQLLLECGVHFSDASSNAGREVAVSSKEKTRPQVTYGATTTTTADLRNNYANLLNTNNAASVNEIGTEDNNEEFGEEFLEKFSDSDRDSGVSDDTMLHYSASEDEIIWRGRVREVKSVFEEAAAANSPNGDAGIQDSPSNGRFRNLSHAEVMQLKSFLKEKDVKIIESSGRGSEIFVHKCERPSFLPLAGMKYYRRNMSSKSSISDELDTPGEEKLSPAADVVCWSGPYMEQEQEQQVLRKMSNPFLIKRRVTSKLDIVDRLEKRIKEQQDRINHLLDQIQIKRAAEDLAASTDMEYGADEQEGTNSEPELNGHSDAEEDSAEDLELQLVEERSTLRRYQKSLKEALDEIAALSAKIEWAMNNNENGEIRCEQEKEMRSKITEETDEESRANSTALSNHRD